MRCEQVEAYLPGYAGGELGSEAARLVATHVEGCRRCRAEVQRQERVIHGLAGLREREVDAPAFLVEHILQGVSERRRPFAPPLPLAAADLGRLVIEHRETIASVAGTVAVAAGAAYALWRAVGRPRAAQQVAG